MGAASPDLLCSACVVITTSLNLGSKESTPVFDCGVGAGKCSFCITSGPTPWAVNGFRNSTCGSVTTTREGSLDSSDSMGTTSSGCGLQSSSRGNGGVCGGVSAGGVLEL